MRELFLTFFSRGLPAIGAVLFNVILIQILDIDAAGSVFYWVTNLYLIGFFSTLGLDIFLLKSVSTGRSALASGEKRTAFVVSFLIPLVLIPLVENSAVLILASGPFFTQVAINSKILRGKGDYFSAGICEQTSIFSLAAFVLWLCLNFEMPLGVQEVALILFASAFGMFFLTELKVGEQYRLIRLNAGRVFEYDFRALTFVVFPLITYGAQWMPVYFLGHLGGSEISIYTISVRCISLLAFVSLSIDSYLLPRLAKLYGKREHREINILMKKVINASMGFSVFLGFIYILMGPMVVTFWAGDAYESSYYVALPILFMYLLSFIFGPYQSYLLMSGGERDVNWANAMAFVIVFVICFFLQENKILSAGWASFAIMVGRGISIVYVWYRGRRLMDERLLID